MQEAKKIKERTGRMHKLLFICKQRKITVEAGVKDFGEDHRNGSYGLINSCKLIARSLEYYYPDDFRCEVVTVVDNNGIDRVVHEKKPTHVFIEALWVVPEKFYELLPLHPTVKWAVRIHSKTPFLSNEGVAFDWVNRYMGVAAKFSNFTVSGNDAEFTLDLEEAYRRRFTYLPNLYLADWGYKRRPFEQKDHIDVGCFGAIRPMKNQLQQAVAAVMFANEQGKKLRFHMNGRAEQRGEQVLSNIQSLMKGTGHELVLHGWHTHKGFLSLVGQMDIGMQVSFSESFNIVSADFVSQDVPIVVSEDITWASGVYMADTTSAEDIKNKLKMAYRWRKVNLHHLNKIGLRKYNDRAIRAWLDYVFDEDSSL
jgi:hypothetical protein